MTHAHSKQPISCKEIMIHQSAERWILTIFLPAGAHTDNNKSFYQNKWFSTKGWVLTRMCVLDRRNMSGLYILIVQCVSIIVLYTFLYPKSCKILLSLYQSHLSIIVWKKILIHIFVFTIREDSNPQFVLFYHELYIKSPLYFIFNICLLKCSLLK